MFRCVIEDNSYTAIQVNGYVNLTVNNSHISGSYYGISVSSSEIGEEIPIPDDRAEMLNVSFVVDNTEIEMYGTNSYGVRCSGQTVDCHVTNSRLQAILCENVHSCTVQRCTMNSTRSLYTPAVNAVRVQTLVIDSNIIANKIFGQAVRASRCNSVQASFIFFFPAEYVHDNFVSHRLHWLIILNC